MNLDFLWLVGGRPKNTRQTEGVDRWLLARSNCLKTKRKILTVGDKAMTLSHSAEDSSFGIPGTFIINMRLGGVARDRCICCPQSRDLICRFVSNHVKLTYAHMCTAVMALWCGVKPWCVSPSVRPGTLSLGLRGGLVGASMFAQQRLPA